MSTLQIIRSAVVIALVVSAPRAGRTAETSQRDTMTLEEGVTQLVGGLYDGTNKTGASFGDRYKRVAEIAYAENRWGPAAVGYKGRTLSFDQQMGRLLVTTTVAFGGRQFYGQRGGSDRAIQITTLPPPPNDPNAKSAQEPCHYSARMGIRVDELAKLAGKNTSTPAQSSGSDAVKMFSISINPPSKKPPTPWRKRVWPWIKQTGKAFIQHAPRLLPNFGTRPKTSKQPDHS